MVTTHGITSAAGYYENTVRQKKDSTVKAKNNTASEQAVKSSEDKLSSKACYKVNQLVLVNLDIIDEYLETFHIVEEDFYK